MVNQQYQNIPDNTNNSRTILRGKNDRNLLNQKNQYTNQNQEQYVRQNQ